MLRSRFSLSFVFALLVASILISPAMAQPPGSGTKQPPQDEGEKAFETLMKRYAELRDKVVNEQVNPAPPKDRMNIWLKVNPLIKMSPQFFDIVSTYPNSNGAVRALNVLISQGNPDVKAKAIEMLIDKYVDDDRIMKNMNAITTGLPSANTEKWLQRIVAKSKNKKVQGTAIQAQLDYIRSVKQVRDFAKRQPDFAAQAGAEVNNYLANYDFDAAEDTRVKLLNRLSKEFEGVPSGIVGKTFADRANSQLYIINKLSVGRPAMEITGADLDDKSFKLSDYRGKVVLLIFWGDWAPPAQRMYQQLRSINNKLKDKPFAIVGVNGDDEKEFAKKLVAYQKLDWRNFYNGGKQGDITKAWKVNSWPTTYVLDGKGVIRYKQVQKTDLDNAITTLLKEMGHTVDLADHSDGKIELVGPAPKPKNPSKNNFTLSPNANRTNTQAQRAPNRPRNMPPRGPRFKGPITSGVMPDLDGDGKPGIDK